MPRADHVSGADVAHTLEWVCGKVNSAIQKAAGQATIANEKLLKDFCEGALTVAQVAKGWTEPPEPIRTKDFVSLARRFKRKSNLTVQSTNTSGSYLPFDDPKMQQCLAENIVQFS